MKRISIVLSLILCLVLCVFTFASCSKKNKVANTTAGGTDAPASSTPSGTGTPSGDETTGSPSVTVPVHVHTPGAYEVVKPATCSDVGEEAQFCTECGEKILESVQLLPTVADAHVVEKWDITPASMFSDGLQTGHCTACGQDLEKVLTWEPDITVIDLDREKVIDPKDFASKGRNTPFAGWKLKGWPVLTILNGKVTWQDDDCLM